MASLGLDWFHVPSHVHWDVQRVIIEMTWGLSALKTSASDWPAQLKIDEMRECKDEKVAREWWHELLKDACKRGHIVVAQLAAGQCKHYSKCWRAMRNACHGGHREIAEWLIADWLIPKHGRSDFDWALHCACCGGQRDVASWLITHHNASDFNWAFRSACSGGHRDLAEWLITEHGASDFDSALGWANHNKQLNVAEWLIEEYGAKRW